MPKRRFILFHGSPYYAHGGWHDGPQFFYDLKEAIAEGIRLKLQEDGYYWWHVVDLEACAIVAGSHPQACDAPNLDDALVRIAKPRE